MTYISIVPAAAVRVEPSHRSEMSTQLLFGETCLLLDQSGDFYKVKCSYDNYEGWCQKSQLAVCNIAGITAPSYVSQWSAEVLVNGQSAIVPHGSVVLPPADAEAAVEGYKMLYLSQDQHQPASTDDQARLIKEFAYRYLNTAYLWGGKSVFGTDCSGFAQQVFKMAGIWLPRDSSQQATHGATLDFIQEARLGDLAFFDNDEGAITHVGIMLSDKEIIHSSGYVHVDRIDSAGITHHVTGQRTHKLRILKRYF